MLQITKYRFFINSILYEECKINSNVSNYRGLNNDFNQFDIHAITPLLVFTISILWLLLFIPTTRSIKIFYNRVIGGCSLFEIGLRRLCLSLIQFLYQIQNEIK